MRRATRTGNNRGAPLPRALGRSIASRGAPEITHTSYFARWDYPSDDALSIPAYRQRASRFVKEIRWLGKDRICQIHLKDNPGYLGEGTIDFSKVLAEIRQIGFDGYANLETEAPSKAVEDDMRKNLAYVRGVMARPA